MRKKWFALLSIILLYIFTTNSCSSIARDELTTADDHDITDQVELSTNDKIPQGGYTGRIQVFEVYGGSDYHTLANHLAEIDLSVKKAVDANLQGTMQMVMINEEIFEGEYDYTESSKLYQDSIKFYKGQTDYHRTYTIGFRNNKLSSLQYDTPYSDSPIRTQATHDECKRIAENFLIQIVENIHEYTLYETKYDAIPEYGGGLYRYTYVRMIGDYLSDEVIKIHVSARGEVEYYQATMLESLADVTMPSFDETEMIQAVEQKLVDIYGSVSKNYTVTYEINKKIITRVDDGTLCLRYIIGVDIFNAATYEPYASEYVELLIELE